jgi:hypothetical protein
MFVHCTLREHLVACAARGLLAKPAAGNSLPWTPMQELLLDSYLPWAREAKHQFDGDDGFCDTTREASETPPSTSGSISRPLNPSTCHSAVAAQPDLLATSHSGEPKLLRRPLRVTNDAHLYLSLIRDKADCTHLPTQVKIWCKNCKENMRIASTSTYKTAGPYLIDIDPRWTVGKLRVYLLARPKCQTYSKDQFIPVDRTIIFMHSHDLRAWVDRRIGLPIEEVILKFEKRTAKSRRPA